MLAHQRPARHILGPTHEIAHNLGANHVDASQSCDLTINGTPRSRHRPPLRFAPTRGTRSGRMFGSNGSCLTGVTPTPTPTPVPTPTVTPVPVLVTSLMLFDYDGDGRSDVLVFRPVVGTWYLNRSSAGFNAFQFGLNGDLPVPADYDGDGRTDAAVYRAGVWFRMKSSTNTVDVVNFGLAGDIPAPADFDGDGKADVVVFRPSTGVWYFLNSRNGGLRAGGIWPEWRRSGRG